MEASSARYEVEGYGLHSRRLTVERSLVAGVGYEVEGYGFHSRHLTVQRSEASSVGYEVEGYGFHSGRLTVERSLVAGSLLAVGNDHGCGGRGLLNTSILEKNAEG